MTDVGHIVAELRRRAGGRRRFLVAVVGPPGAGKSTFSRALCNGFEQGEAAILQMDGFHYDNAVLDELQLRNRKGAPGTFDFAGFQAILQRLRSGNEAVAVPAFDRTLDLARAGAAIIGPSACFVIVEGNYLLLKEEPWGQLTRAFDYTILLHAKRAELQRRLMSRWLDLGIEAAAARRRVEENDLPNVDLVLSSSHPADMPIGE